MTIIGVLHLGSVTIPSTSFQTPAAAIIKYLSDIYPTQVHHSYHLDHRLFVSTSSLLPRSTNRRAFTHVFTSSHFPRKTYVGTTSPSPSSANVDTTKNDDILNIITIPASTSLEPFTALLQQKLQPQWAARQFVILDNGASLKLPIKDSVEWTLSVGDLRLAPSRTSGPAAGQLRGVMIEVQYDSRDDDSGVDISKDEDKKKYETLFREMLKSLFKQLKLDLKLEDARLYLVQSRVTSFAEETAKAIDPRKEKEDENHVRHSNPNAVPGCEIAETYMEVLRGSRG